jgi:hypothetical protein
MLLSMRFAARHVLCGFVLQSGFAGRGKERFNLIPTVIVFDLAARSLY